MTAASTSQLDRRRPAAGAVVLQGDAGEVKAKVLDVGAGRPVVFLHGLAGLNEHWEDVVDRVKGRVRCIMLELPLLDLGGDDCSIDGVGRLGARFLEHYLPGEHPVLVGNSFGGHVALRIVLERPDLVGGLVLAGSSGLNERTMVREVLIRPTREWMRRKIAELFYEESTLREADVDRAYAEMSDRKRARAMVRLSKTARRDHLGGRIGEIACPTLIIWGRNDIVTPPDAAEEFHRLIRDSRIVWIDRCGHAPMLERPEEFSHALKGFADDLDRRGRR
jgi:2-hydroxy-6-oxonona-2,4-dienedioate hydrolase